MSEACPINPRFVVDHLMRFSKSRRARSLRHDARIVRDSGSRPMPLRPDLQTTTGALAWRLVSGGAAARRRRGAAAQVRKSTTSHSAGRVDACLPLSWRHTGKHPLFHNPERPGVAFAGDVAPALDERRSAQCWLGRGRLRRVRSFPKVQSLDRSNRSSPASAPSEQRQWASVCSERRLSSAIRWRTRAFALARPATWSSHR